MYILAKQRTVAPVCRRCSRARRICAGVIYSNVRRRNATE